MNYTVATLFYGPGAARYRGLLAQWLDAFAHSGVQADLLIVSDRPCPKVEDYGRVFDPHSYPRREGVVFDVKGALMCETILAVSDPILFLDLDAPLQRDPSSVLYRFRGEAIAMPIDLGARCDPEVSGMPKKCAGVAWFGQVERESRDILVHEYKSAWRELLPLHSGASPRHAPHLLEQHAWSQANFRMGGATLPDSMNWPVHFRGPMTDNGGAYVHHEYGKRKWRMASERSSA